MVIGYATTPQCSARECYVTGDGEGKVFRLFHLAEHFPTCLTEIPVYAVVW